MVPVIDKLKICYTLSNTSRLHDLRENPVATFEVQGWDFQLALGREARRAGMNETEFEELVKLAVSQLSMPDCDATEIRRNLPDAYRFAELNKLEFPLQSGSKGPKGPREPCARPEAAADLMEETIAHNREMRLSAPFLPDWIFEGLPSIFSEGLNTARLAMIFTVLRKFDEQWSFHEMTCPEDDFRRAMAVMEVLLQHSLMLSTTLRHEVGSTVEMRHYFRVLKALETLPSNFRYNELMDALHSQGISLSTAKRIRSRLLESEVIVHEGDTYSFKHRKWRGILKSHSRDLGSR